MRYFDQAGAVLAFGYNNRVNNPMLVAPHGNRGITPFFDSNQVTGRLFQEPWRRSLPNQDILFSDDRLRVDHTVFIEVLVGISPVGPGHFLVRYFDPVNLPTRITAFFAFISPEEMRSAKTPVNRCLVENQRIFNIEAFVTQDGNDEVLPGRAIIGTNQF